MSSVFAQRRQKLLSLKALRGSSPAPAHTEEACPACGKAVPRRELVELKRQQRHTRER